MPFELWVTRAARFEDRASSPAEPIRVGDLERLLTAPWTERRGDTWRVSYPGSGEPWLVARVEPAPGRTDAGHLVLSVSYSNHRFIRNMADAFDLALRLADALKARVFEEVRGQRITAENVDSIVVPETEYSRFVVGSFKAQQQAQLARGMAPLELPLGAVDWVSEFLAFDVPPSAPTDGKNLLEGLGGLTLKVSPEPGAPLALADPADGVVLVLVAARDGRLRVSPAHGQAAFSRLAPATLAVARGLASRLAMPLHLGGRPFDGPRAEEVERLASGLGVDLFERLQGAASPSTAAPSPDPARAGLAAQLLATAGLAMHAGGGSLVDRFLLAKPDEVDEALVAALWSQFAGDPAHREAKARALELLTLRIAESAGLEPARRQRVVDWLRPLLWVWFGRRAGAPGPAATGRSPTRPAQAAGPTEFRPVRASAPPPARSVGPGVIAAAALVVVCLIAGGVSFMRRMAASTREQAEIRLVREARRRVPRDVVATDDPAYVRPPVAPVDLFDQGVSASSRALALLRALDPGLRAERAEEARTLVCFVPRRDAGGERVDVTVHDLTDGVGCTFVVEGPFDAERVAAAVKALPRR